MLDVGETPARAAGHLEYVHVACTGYLTAMHTGGRPAAGGVLGGYGGTLVRDGYAGYRHLTGALHGWCGARNLPDPRDLYTFDPGGQLRARSMAGLLIHATAAATAVRAAGRPRLSGEQLAQISAWYRGAVAKGITGNQHRRKHNRQGRAAAGTAVPRQPGHDPAVRHRPGRRIYQQPGRLCRVRGYADTALDVLARGRARPGEASINTAATVRKL